jgi:hypothetical protein
LFQRGQGTRVAAVTEGNGDISQITAALGALDRADFEFLVEILRGEGQLLNEGRCLNFGTWRES